ncbi:MAG: hypothetical protein J6V55_07690 [Alistipes sp.]|nr:hypothetical protein [Alistipes sp.]
MRIKRLLAMAVATVVLCSCSYTTTYIGSITTYNADGSVLKKWDKVCLHEQSNNYTTGNAFKPYGVNFYDLESGRFIVIGNSVPYVVEYDIIKRNTNDDQNDAFKMELINRHDHLCYMLEEYKINLKYSKKDSEEHKKWKETIERTKIEISNISYTLSHEYSYYID